MNNKHIACLVVLFLGILIMQGVSAIHHRAIDLRNAAESARQDAETTAQSLLNERRLLGDTKAKTAELIAYLDQWEPYLSDISTPESAELNVTSLVKQYDLVLLAQRFELAPNKSEGSSVPGAMNVTIPQLVRAHLTIEDDFIKSINWLGDLENKLPTARVSNLEIARGQSGNDIRMDLEVEIPLANPRPTPSPTATPNP